MRAKYFYRILFVILCLVICFSSAAYASDRVKWYSCEEGKALAKIEKKNENNQGNKHFCGRNNHRGVCGQLFITGRYCPGRPVGYRKGRDYGK